MQAKPCRGGPCPRTDSQRSNRWQGRERLPAEVRPALAQQVIGQDLGDLMEALA